MVAQIDKRFISKSLKKTYTRLLSYFLFEGRPLTTKGRWLNPLIFFSYNIQEKLSISNPVSKPIYILGTGRSGTTILGISLGIHNDVGFLNEPKALWSHLNECDDLIGSYHEEAGRYYLNETDTSDRLIERAHTLFGSYLRLSLSTRLVDKYPEHIFRVPFVKKIFPDAKFLFLFRNGWDTCHSIKNWSARSGRVDRQGGVDDWWGKNNRKWKLLCDQVVANDLELGVHITVIRAYENHIYRAAVEWIVTMKQGLALSSDPQVMHVKYESFVSSQSFRNKIMSFCDLGVDQNFEDYCNEVLRLPSISDPIRLPYEISGEFNRVMILLGYV
jgi:hypothetical protein